MSNRLEDRMSADSRAPEYKEADQRTAPQQQQTTRPVVPTPQARAGVTGHNVRYVLAIGIAAVIVAFVIVYMIYFV
jgi:Flp pilus assembly protein TadB